MRKMRIVVDVAGGAAARRLPAGFGAGTVGRNQDNAHWRRRRVGLRHRGSADTPALCHAQHAHDGDRCGDREDAGRYSGAEEVAWHGDCLRRWGAGSSPTAAESGAILVFDLKTYAVLGKLATMPDSDGIIYDKTQDLVLAVSGDGGALMTFKPDIDPVNGKIDPPIELGGAPEFLAVRWRGQGLRQPGRQGPGGSGGPEDAQGDRALAGCAGRPPGGDGDRQEDAPLVHRLPQSAKADRDEHGRRQGSGGPAHRRGRGCDQDPRRPGICKLRRRNADGGRARRRASSKWSRW